MMRRAYLALFAIIFSGCSWWSANGHAAKDIVTVASLACAESSALTDAKELAATCLVVAKIEQLTPEILQFVDKLIAQRETLKAAGYHLDKRAARWVK